MGNCIALFAGTAETAGVMLGLREYCLDSAGAHCIGTGELLDPWNCWMGGHCLVHCSNTGVLVRVVGIACVGGTLLGTLGTLVHSSLHYWSGCGTLLGCSDGTFGTGALLVLVLEHCLCG